MTLVTLKNKRDGIPANRLFNNFFNEGLLNRIQEPVNHYKPAVNIREFTDKFVIDLFAPGLDKKSFKINIEKELLSISTALENEDSNAAEYKMKEFDFSNFKRSFSVPDSVNIEKISASYTNGILSIELPKEEKAIKKVRDIKVS